MIDVNHQVSAVRRTVGSRVLEAGEARVVTVSQSYPTDAADLWDACTNIERIPRWFLPISGDLKLGGQYRLEGNASGTILTCDPPRAFSATWEYGGAVSWIEVHITGEGPDEARLELEHIAHVDDDTWRQFGPGAVGIGWDLGLVGLAIHLSNGRDPSIPRSGSSGPRPKTAVDSWRCPPKRGSTPNVAGGADPEAARASADRCAAAYLAEA